MADKNELKNMVLMFRVSELQLLLGLTSQSRCGRKTELMQRALNMLDRGVSSHVQNKIKELYQRFVTRGTTSSTPVLTNHTNPSSMTSSVTSGGGSVGGVAGVGQGRPMNAVHKGLSELLNQHNGAPVTAPVVYPEVRFKHLPFYDVLAELVRPVSLVPRNSSRQQEMKINFCFSEDHLKQISSSRDISTTTNRVDFKVQVQMRFCVLDVSSRQPDCFPTTICVKVNGVLAQLPNPIPTNKPGAVPKRPSRPVDITQLCRFSPTMSNSISIAWTVEDNRHYCVVIYLVRKLNSQILLERLQKTSILKPEHTKKLISEKLTLESDNDLALTSLRISLICPLGKMRMTIPCRSQTCDHLQCFDSITFLQMNEKKPTWFCPVCDRPAEFNKLIIDGFISEIIRDSNDSTEIELTKDGAWSVTRSEELTNEDKHINTNNNNNNTNNEDNKSPYMDSSMDGLPTTTTTTSSSLDEVIDLTGDDDDDYRYEVEDSKEGLEALKKAMEEEMKAKEQQQQQSSSSSTPRPLKQTTLLPMLGQQNSTNNGNKNNNNVASMSLTTSAPSKNQSASAIGNVLSGGVNANGVDQVPQPIALTFNSRTNTPPPPLPPSPPPSSSSSSSSHKPHAHHHHHNNNNNRDRPPLPSDTPTRHHHLPPPLPSSPPPPPLPRTPPSLRPTPPLPPAAHQHHRSPSYLHQPFDLSTTSKSSSLSLPSTSSSTSSSALPPLPPIPPPSMAFPFPMLPGFIPPAFHPAHPYFNASYEAWAHLHSSPDAATAAGMLDFFSMMNAGIPDFSSGIPDYSAAAAAAFGAMNPFALATPPPSFLEYFYRTAAAAAAANSSNGVSSSSTTIANDTTSSRGNSSLR